jgi:hypothetical protein
VARVRAASGNQVPYNRAIRIGADERDWALNLSNGKWPSEVDTPQTWEHGENCFWREIAADKDAEVACSLVETILRFPSAPIHSVQRLHEYHSRLPESLHFHTYRVLTSASSPQKRIERIFLFHNGLNELDRMGLYYKLASQLIAHDKTGTIACILRPFPSHLTRAPFSLHFAETPLQRYLWDGSQLFQQFLRYMVETQWFLSAIVKRSRYPCLAGADLLAQNKIPANSRLDPDVLAKNIVTEFTRMNKASTTAFADVVRSQRRARPITDAPARERLLEITKESILSLRSVLTLDQYPDLGVEFNKGEREPSIHVIGYSLGGFAAQSIFMSWPSVISSCSTLLSGGALRELSPTAFANPEEWQTVLHSLRYELDDWMVDRKADGDTKNVAGLPREVFHHFKRTFYEVFQQEYRGSFGTRLEAFRKRMLFIVGGDDSIVRPQSVLASGPPGGINLLEVGGIGHFLGSQAKGEEKEQRKFWVPEMGGLIHRFSKQAAREQQTERDRLWRPQSGTSSNHGAPASESTAMLRDQDILDLPSDGALSNKLFGRCLDDILAHLNTDREKAEQDAKADSGSGGGARRMRSRLIVARNELPEVLLDARTLQDRARAFHHDELSVVRYCQSAMRRRDEVAHNASCVRVLLPWNARRIVEYLDPSHGFPSQSETAAGHRPRKDRSEAIWKKFTAACQKEFAGVVAVFDGRSVVTPDRSRLGEKGKEFIEQCRLRTKEGPLWVPSIPDCWIWYSPEFLNLSYEIDKREADEKFVDRVKSLYDDDSKEEENRLTDLSGVLREGKLRVITISRSRYNPRFRGKLVFDAATVKQVLNHVAICLAISLSYEDFIAAELDGASEDEREWTASLAGTTKTARP